MVSATRLFGKPILYSTLDKSIGININGPSLIRVPDWINKPLGKYYLYFAHHKGKYIRLAYADDLRGPWRVYKPGSLQLSQTLCVDHIASPDVHVDHERRRIIMYYHGKVLRTNRGLPVSKIDRVGRQRTFAATTRDATNFVSGDEILGTAYFRVWVYGEYHYAIGMPGYIYRSKDGLTGFQRGPVLFDRNIRHSAVLRINHELFVFYSNVGDEPEHILCAKIDLTKDWNEWRPSTPRSVLMPEKRYEGADLRLEPSRRGAVFSPVRQLRDPGIFVDDDRVYLLYTVAGEHGIAICEIDLAVRCVRES